MKRQKVVEAEKVEVNKPSPIDMEKAAYLRRTVPSIYITMGEKLNGMGFVCSKDLNNPIELNGESYSLTRSILALASELELVTKLLDDLSSRGPRFVSGNLIRGLKVVQLEGG